MTSLADFKIGKLVAEAPSYRLFIAQRNGEEQELLLQVARELEHNGTLDRAAFVLRKLKRIAGQFEAQYAKENPDDDRGVNYDRLFPELVDSFIAQDQEGRRVNILAFKDVDDIASMAPLSNLTTLDSLRAELPSSAWIMGRLLKLLALTHAAGVSVNLLTGNNVLIHPDRHFVVVLDWTAAEKHPGGVPLERCSEDIAQAARAVFTSIGGDPVTLDYPYEMGENGDEYVMLLRRLATHQEQDAYSAHVEFYRHVHQLFGRKFRPFQTLSL